MKRLREELEMGGSDLSGAEAAALAEALMGSTVETLTVGTWAVHSDETALVGLSSGGEP